MEVLISEVKVGGSSWEEAVGEVCSVVYWTSGSFL